MLEAHLKVRPSASRQDIKILDDGRIKVFLKSPPEKNKANRELIKFLSKILSVRRSDIKIDSGEKSRKKKLIIKSITAAEFKRAVKNQSSLT